MSLENGMKKNFENGFENSIQNGPKKWFQKKVEKNNVFKSEI